MHREHEELLAEQISEALGKELLSRILSGEAKPADLTVALNYIKHHGVTDDDSRPGSPVRSVAEAVRAQSLAPFSSLEQDIDD